MIQYRLSGKKHPATYSMKINDAMGLKDGYLKEIGYYRGYSTPFTEEVIKLNKEAKKCRPPMFTFKKHINATTLDVKESDIALINFIEKHEHFGVRFERYSENIESKRKLGEYAQVEEALAIVNESDEYRVKALGLCIIGFDTYGKEPLVITRELKELAFKNPKKVISEYGNVNFDNKLLVSLAFCSNVIEANNNQTAIQWVDGKGRILGIATGEDSILKMTEFLSTKSPESGSVLQEIGKRLDKIIAKKTLAVKEESKIKSLEEKIKELTEELAKKDVKEIKVNDAYELPSDLGSMTLKEAQFAYRQHTKKNPPNKHRNDVEWLVNALKDDAEIDAEELVETEGD